MSFCGHLCVSKTGYEIIGWKFLASGEFTRLSGVVIERGDDVITLLERKSSISTDVTK